MARSKKTSLVPLGTETLFAEIANALPGMVGYWDRDLRNNAAEGIVVTGEDEVILSVNPAFTEITGYSAEEAVGQSPRMLKSLHHDRAFYVDMWRSLGETGRWQGEIWNRRKGGEVYLEWMTITRIPGLREGRPSMAPCSMTSRNSAGTTTASGIWPSMIP